MDKAELKDRTKKFALRTIKLVGALSKNSAGTVMGKQLLRSATSVAANYRAACRARSKTEFIAKVGIVVEEADESCFWLEMLIESGLIKPVLAEPLLKEANEITAIMYVTKVSASNNKS